MKSADTAAECLLTLVPLSEEDEIDSYASKVVATMLLAEALSNLRTLATEAHKTNAILKAMGRVTEA